MQVSKADAESGGEGRRGAGRTDGKSCGRTGGQGCRVVYHEGTSIQATCTSSSCSSICGHRSCAAYPDSTEAANAAAEEGGPWGAYAKD